MAYMKIYLSPDKKVFRMISPPEPKVILDGRGRKIPNGFDGNWGRLSRDLEPINYGVEIIKL